jgi:hypothetical protein
MLIEQLIRETLELRGFRIEIAVSYRQYDRQYLIVIADCHCILFNIVILFSMVAIGDIIGKKEQRDVRFS